MAQWSKKPGANVAVGRGRLRKLLPSGVWHFHYKNDAGKWVSKSTSHRDRAGAINVLAERTARQGYVLPLRQAKSRPDVAERRFIDDLKDLSAAVGMPKKRLTLHFFRHFCVSECADHGVPMARVMNWVGHDEMKMVTQYYSLRDDTAREAMRRLTASTTVSPPTARGISESASITGAAANPPHAPQADPGGSNGKNGRSGHGGRRPAA